VAAQMGKLRAAVYCAHSWFHTKIDDTKTVELSFQLPFMLMSVVLNVLGGLAQLDLVYSLSESKGAKTFVAAFRCRTEIHKHERFAISAEAVLKKVSQLGVAERNVVGALSKGVKHVSEAAQTLVDGLCLFQPLRVTARSTSIQALTSG
jgi:predicted transcriptional regulator